MQETITLSEANRAAIDKWIAKYPPERKSSAVMGALMVVQDDQGGWLTRPAMNAVADYLEMDPIAVYEVATFYSMYELKEVGQHKLCVCTNVSCMLCGSDEIVDYLKQKLGIGFGEVTADKKFSLKEVECLGACGGGPMMQIGDTYYENLTPSKIDEILSTLD